MWGKREELYKALQSLWFYYTVSYYQIIPFVKCWSGPWHFVSAKNKKWSLENEILRGSLSPFGWFLSHHQLKIQCKWQLWMWVNVRWSSMSMLEIFSSSSFKMPKEGNLNSSKIVYSYEYLTVFVFLIECWLWAFF